MACALVLSACATSKFDYTPQAAAQFTDQDVYYLEVCAGSGVRMRPGFPPDVSGRAGGHTAFFLGGACAVPDSGYPVLALCDSLPPNVPQGAGVSMDGNFQNANWVVTPGQSFFYDADLAPGEALTPARFDAVHRQAEAMGLLNGIVFRPELYHSKPQGMSDEEYRYRLSIGTDWGIGLARGRYCARVPVTRGQMVRVVDFLNAKNALYRVGPRHFESSIFLDNCVHLAHNALAAAGIWGLWPTDGFLPAALFDFPVPKNDFVNVMRRANDTPMTDLAALYTNPIDREALLQSGRLPSEPGTLAAAYPVHAPNEIFGTQVSLIAYDANPLRPVERWSDKIFAEPRYTDRIANLRYFAALYAGLDAARRPMIYWQARLPVADRAGFPAFYDAFYARLDALRGQIAQELAPKA